jgi:hypothetical protein
MSEAKPLAAMDGTGVLLHLDLKPLFMEATSIHVDISPAEREQTGLLSVPYVKVPANTLIRSIASITYFPSSRFAHGHPEWELFALVVGQVALKVMDGAEILEAKLKHKLNPFSITIDRIDDLPNTPLSFSQLSTRCAPLWCLMRVPSLPPMVCITDRFGMSYLTQLA